MYVLVIAKKMSLHFNLKPLLAICIFQTYSVTIGTPVIIKNINGTFNLKANLCPFEGEVSIALLHVYHNKYFIYLGLVKKILQIGMCRCVLKLNT